MRVQFADSTEAEDGEEERRRSGRRWSAIAQAMSPKLPSMFNFELQHNLSLARYLN